MPVDHAYAKACFWQVCKNKLQLYEVDLKSGIKLQKSIVLGDEHTWTKSSAVYQSFIEDTVYTTDKDIR